MSAPQLSRRSPRTDVVSGRGQELDPNIAVLQLLTGKWSTIIDRPQFEGRDGWFDGKQPIQVCCRPASHGINRRNVMTLGARMHRRDPVIAIHMFARDPVALSKLREEVDRIIINEGVNPMSGIQYILPATWPSLPGDFEEKDEGGTVFHDIYYVECLYYKTIRTGN